MVFGAPGTDEKKMTAHLDTKMAAFSWVTERHFDLLFECGDSLRHGQDELLRLVVVRSPKDKILVLQAVLQIAVGKFVCFCCVISDLILPFRCY